MANGVQASEDLRVSGDRPLCVTGGPTWRFKQLNDIHQMQLIQS